MEAVRISNDAGHNLKLNQTMFFYCVEDDKAHMLQAIVKNHKVDVNAYNDGARRKKFIICLLKTCFCLFCLSLCSD